MIEEWRDEARRALTHEAEALKEQLYQRQCYMQALDATEDLYGEGDDPIIINSGFRSAEVNKAVGGVPNSNHLTGCAVDIRCVGMEQALRYAAILLDISDLNKEDYDELLIEQRRNVVWIHFAVKSTGNRRRTSLELRSLLQRPKAD